MLIQWTLKLLIANTVDTEAVTILQSAGVQTAAKTGQSEKSIIEMIPEEIEIQKYHYLDDWWKNDRSPLECRSSIRSSDPSHS